jgi:hypothetical protein
LWLHAGRERILFPEHDGRFAGRTRAEWFAALAPPWEAATGRKSERPIAKGSQQT